MTNQGEDMKESVEEGANTPPTSPSPPDNDGFLKTIRWMLSSSLAVGTLTAILLKFVFGYEETTSVYWMVWAIFGTGVIFFIQYAFVNWREKKAQVVTVFFVFVSFVLGIALLRTQFYSIPKMDAEQQRKALADEYKKLLETSAADKNQNDQLEQWGNIVKVEMLQCHQEKYQDKPDVHFIKDTNCASKVIADHKLPTLNSNDLRENLEYEIHAGNILLKDSVIAELFQRKIGIGKTFLGTGITLPQTATAYTDARLPEYLVENKSDGIEEIFTWILTPKINRIDTTVESLIVGCGDLVAETTSNKNDASHQQIYATGIKKIKDNWNEEKPPILVRFQQFPSKLYQNHLGQPGADRVFMCRLKDVWKISLQDAL